MFHVVLFMFSWTLAAYLSLCCFSSDGRQKSLDFTYLFLVILSLCYVLDLMLNADCMWNLIL